jgi:uncharacterized repeat protein (TIGR03803 family)
MAGSVALVVSAGFAQAQQSPTAHAAMPKPPNETVLYSFTGGADGTDPNAGVIFDGSGALYGTTTLGGTFNSGTVYKLTPQGEGHRWTSTVLHSFSGGTDGVSPFAGVIFDSSGALYGTTAFGGNSSYGTVYKLTPPTDGGTLWKETVLYNFTGGADGANPSNGSLIFDSSGALYGGTINGGNSGNGTVYKLTPPAGGGTPWNETVLYSFTGGADGRYGSSSLIFDSSGALYGTAGGGGNLGNGTVYKLTPSASGTVWNLTVLYAFAAGTGPNGGVDGELPSYAPLIFDRSGALYGTTRAGGPCQGCGGGYGTVYKLSPPANGMPLGTPWTETVLHFFTSGADGYEPDGGVIFDSSGALYGTTSQGGVGYGTVFRLTPSASGNPWTKTILHSFSSAPDGANPLSGLIFDRHDGLYGTTSRGGSVSDFGTVFRVVQ